jgi:hypothetical protein
LLKDDRNVPTFIRVRAYTDNANNKNNSFQYLEVLPDVGNRSVCLMAESAFRGLRPKEQLSPSHLSISTAEKETFLHVLGRAATPIALEFYNPDRECKDTVVYHVKPVVVRNLQMDMLLSGRDLATLQLVPYLHKGIARLGKSPNRITVPMRPQPHSTTANVVTEDNVTIPANSEHQFRAQCDLGAPGEEVMIEPSQELLEATGMYAAATIDHIRAHNRVHVRVLNMSDHPISIKAKTHVGHAVSRRHQKMPAKSQGWYTQH